MIDAEKWVDEFIDKMLLIFGERLLFVGLQGSYRRKEATEKSDIDIVVILDYLDLNDLKAYRSLISAMPQGDKACGFISGCEELANWPKHEIFQLKQDTAAKYGKLGCLLPSIEKKDVAEGIRIATSGLYHTLCHTYIYGDKEERKNILKTAYKSVFFILQVIFYLKNDVYCDTKHELLGSLKGEEQELLKESIRVKEKRSSSFETEADKHFERLIRWTSEAIRSV